MSDNPDIDELAERYLDLWQDQLSALADDPDFAETMTRLMGSSAAAMPGAAAWAAWPAALAGLVPGAAGERAGDGKDEEQAAGKAGSGPGAAPAGAQTAAAAPGAGGADLVELARRLAALEDRVAALESRPERGRGGAQGGSRKRRA
jgi:hypothetical protein